MRARALLTVLVLASCGPPVDEEPYVDHDLGVLREGLLVGQATGCDTSIVSGLTQQLVAELNCIAPNTMVDFSAPNISVSAATQPYLNPDAAAALQATATASGSTISLSSAYRSVAQQFLLYTWWQASQCGIQTAAPPGSSNHQSGRAIDVPSYSTWKAGLTAHGWTWFGSADLVHFDYFTAPDISSKSVLAFQRLWNKNNPGDMIAEDSDWGPQTSARMAQSPTTGFATYGCTMMVMTGTLKGHVFDAAQPATALPAATVTIGAHTPAVDLMGDFSIDLPPGTYSIAVSAPGYVSRTVPGISVVTGQTTMVPLGLDAMAMSMPDAGTPDAGMMGAPDAGMMGTPDAGTDATLPVVTLMTPAPGTAVAAAQVTLAGTATDAHASITSLTLSLNGGAAVPVQLTGNGFSQMVHLAPGSNAVSFVATDAVGASSTTVFMLTFKTGVDGLVEDGFGKPVGQVVVSADNASVETAGDGTFHLDLAPGHYTVSAETSAQPVDVGTEVRASVTLKVVAPEAPRGCGCTSGPAGLPVLMALTALLRRRRPRGQ